MKKTATTIASPESISDMHRLLCLPAPLHPLVSVINLKDVPCIMDENLTSLQYNFYSICTKRDFKGRMKYGQNYYDFDNGIMTFFSPGQVISTEGSDVSVNGMWLMIHPDFLRGYALDKTIKEYGFFSYATHEALHLSEAEEDMINGIMRAIEKEYQQPIDGFSQDVMVSQTELLLNYCNRFYNRQFITRKQANNDLITKMEQVLTDHFNGTEACLPRVKELADYLNVSPGYLSDMLRAHTGQNAQQHIHSKLIDKAKEILSTTELTVSEIAYRLGFEHPQSFSKLFKAKANVSPLEYRRLFN
ncbi:helix-turn-helix domain-containing protein [Flavobacterium psychrotrophum]|uniref:helix-turn-helix domain-containing protein n=1 Tax=Flavobacterium psychrotrophum TaxID=2294119 RepID=UPI000E31678B|nr:helix-turn-helix transcriptional regulator [Flavobacterium psychrotrophum]